MALAFQFDGRPSPVRSWDIRFRVAGAALLGAALVAAPAPALAPLGLVTLGLLALAGVRWTEGLGVVRGFLGFLVFFWILGWAFEPTAANAAFLGLQSARLLLLLLSGHILLTAATPADVAEGLRWYLGWLGPRRAWAAASMAGWALGSVPLILDQAGGLTDAARLRGLDPGRRPGRFVGLLTLGLLVRTVTRSTDLADALAARSFGASAPEPRLRARPRDALALGAVAAAVGLSWAGGVILAP